MVTITQHKAEHLPYPNKKSTPPMALHNDPRLYTGGAVVVDSSPYVNFAIQTDLRKKAKEEALDQYYRSLDKQVNPAGMRTQDIPVLMENENARREYYRQNRSAIMNPRLDGGRAQTEFQNMFQKSLGTVQQSKGAADVYKTLAPVLADPDKRQRIMRSTMHSIQQHDLPINDPNFKQFNISELAYDPKPFDQSKYIKDFADIKMDKVPTIVATDGKNMTRTISNTYSFNDDAKQAVATRAIGNLNSNPSFEKFIGDEWQNIKSEGQDSPRFKAYNETFKKNFGHDMGSEEDLAVAYTANLLQDSRKENEIKEDAFGQRKAIAYLNDGLIRGRMKLADTYAKGRIDYKNATTKATQEGILNGFIEKQIEEGKSPSGSKSINGKAATGVIMNGQRFEGTEVRMPKFVNDKLSIFAGNDKWEEPETYIISKDKKYVIPVFSRKDKNGNPVPRDKAGNIQVDVNKSKPILMEDYKGMLGKEWLSKNQVGDEVVDDFEDDGNEGAPQAPTSTTTSTRTTERKTTQRLAKPTKGELD
jgi:hypothetical protein